MKNKKLYTTFLVALIASTSTHHATAASDWFSMANLQNIGTNIFAIPGTIGQYLQIDKLLSSIAPSLWNSYGARERQAITGVVTTLATVIIGLAYRYFDEASATKQKIKKDTIKTLNNLAKTVDLLFTEYNDIYLKSKYYPGSQESRLLTSETLAKLDQSVDTYTKEADNYLTVLNMVGLDEEGRVAYNKTIESIKRLQQTSSQLEELLASKSSPK